MSLLKLNNLKKTFGSTTVLKGINFDLFESDIIALLGENGAGKSTLMKIIAGVYQPDEGEIFLDDQKVNINSPKLSQELGISIIHQEFNLLPELSIAENIFLGRMPRDKLGFIKWQVLYEETKELLTKVGIDHLSPKKATKECSIAEQQLIEIAKSLSFKSRILIMDEPTATLNDEETDNLIELMKSLNKEKIGIIFITHRLDEIFKVANKAIVLRDGKFIGEKNISETHKDELITMMVGRELNDVFPSQRISHGEILLKVENLYVKDMIEKVSFNLHSGEILGIAGLMGSGKGELSRILFGLHKVDNGSIKVNNNQVNNVKSAISNGIALLTDDRKNEGLVLDLSVKENLILPSYKKISNLNVINKKLEKTKSKEWIEKLSIKVSNSNQEVGQLSGGNQQKVVLGKWLETHPDVLILNEPTRGVDVGAKVEIYKIINEIASQGIGIILISSDMPEIIGLSHRIIVMHEGQISGELSKQDATQEKIFSYAIGGKSDGE